MQSCEIRQYISSELKARGISIRTKNAIDALCTLFPPASVLWQLLSGAKDSLETEKGRITQDVILDMLLEIDRKLGAVEGVPAKTPTFEILLEGVRAYGDVTGLRAQTSDPVLARLFSEKEVKILLKDVSADGNVTGLDLTVDTELELKKRLHVQNDAGSVTFNPGDGREVTFGKGLQKKD